jgi:hypothetical protein
MMPYISRFGYILSYPRSTIFFLSLVLEHSGRASLHKTFFYFYIMVNYSSTGSNKLESGTAPRNYGSATQRFPRDCHAYHHRQEHNKCSMPYVLSNGLQPPPIGHDSKIPRVFGKLSSSAYWNGLSVRKMQTTI